MSVEENIRQTSLQIEKTLDILGQPLKPHLPLLSRFLVVVTFYEDALRIMIQWYDQRNFLERSRGFPSGISHLFLLLNVVAMLVFSSTVITKKHVMVSVCVLTGVIVSQAIGYGLIFNLVFLLRNLSIMGGLLLCLSESLIKNRSRNNLFANMTSLSDTERHEYFQLAGRVLLVLLFVGFVFQGEWSLLRVMVSLFGLTACVMMVVGFKAKWSASFLVTLLCIMNLFVNNWWAVHHSESYARDVTKYNFFQCLSIMGGLLLLISIGPGQISYDEKKKDY